MASVALQGVTKTYPSAAGPILAVDRLDLAVDDGALMVLVGPSGCGKTTTLRVVAGLETPSAGRVRIAGQDVTRPESEGPRPGDGFPGFSPLSAPERPEKLEFRPANA